MNHEVAVLPGDGIGPEVIAEARQVLDQVARLTGFGLKWREYPFGASYYLTHHQVLPPGALTELGTAAALLLGAVGDPRVPPGPLEQELLLAIRFHFDQYLNLRPAKSLPHVPLPCPLPPGDNLDLVVVRENTEDFYMSLGGTIDPATGPATSAQLTAHRRLYDFAAQLELQLTPPTPAAYSLGLLTEPGIRRVTRKALELTQARGETTCHVASKANALPQIYGFWDRVTDDEAKKFPALRLSRMNVDNLCYQLPREPQKFGVILCPNLFGDIVSDLVSALAGGLGLAASANIGDSLSMFEPVHGSAPDIAGTGRANPLAAILSGALMLDHLGQGEAAKLVNQAVAAYLAAGERLPLELGGSARTAEVGELVRQELERLCR
ncbi:MAG: isocitrate/isopropylmalate dehydrogenase family protein [Deltaproteobacteria bacterium]|jgi:3-isopropylmalate dehydrogenase|nr:isocitrate/isopropylmalate dehydrogenase family protein [Deltaproteobacteria bacterium]